MSWVNHLPPVCWSTFWKSIFKQQLGCRFDIMDSISSRILTYAIIYVLIHHIIFWLYLYFLNIFFFSSTHVLSSSIDVVLVLSIGINLGALVVSYIYVWMVYILSLINWISFYMLMRRLLHGSPLCLFTHGSHDGSHISSRINFQLLKIYDWLTVNKLPLDIEKTKFMIFFTAIKSVSKWRYSWFEDW